MNMMSQITADDGVEPIWLRDASGLSAREQPLPPERKKKRSLIGIAAMAGLAAAAQMVNANDVEQRKAAGGRSDWAHTANVTVKGVSRPLWPLWNRPAATASSVSLSTSREDVSDMLLEAAGAAESLERLDTVQGGFSKSVPTLIGMDGRLGTAFNGTNIHADGPDGKMAATVLRAQAFQALELRQKWNGVALTGEWLRHKGWKADIHARNWMAEKKMQTGMISDDFRNGIADAIKPVSPSLPESGSQTSSALPAQSPR